jgi:general secretion pathway protein G
MINMLRTKRGEAGFTLVELLIVVAILGILAGVVVFSVQGVQDDSKVNACKTEAAIVRTAQEAFYVKNKAYATNDGALVTAKLLSTDPQLVDTAGTATAYTVTPQTGSGCVAPL